MESSGSGIESTDGLLRSVQSEQHILNFLDSMDNYLILMDSLSVTLRQGWLELASAQHSMGGSRVNSALFNHKSHSASTIVHLPDVDRDMEFLQFTLCKWVPTNDPEKDSEEAKFGEDELMQNKSSSPQSQHSELQEMEEGVQSPVTSNNQAQEERLKLISMFGTLVSPKLRASQLSFETALETLVEISNVRASLIRAYDQVLKDQKNTE